MYCIRLCSIQVHIDVPKSMLQISGELYTRVDKGIDGPFTTKPSDVRDYLPCAPATVADSALCNTSESNPPIISEQPKGAEWPAGCSCGLRGDWGPRDRSLAGAVSPDGGLLAKTLRPSCGAPLDVPTPPTVLMRPAAPANDPTACHAPAVDLEAASAVRVNPTAASAAHADRPAHSAAPGCAVDSDTAFGHTSRGRVERAGGSRGKAPGPMATGDEATAAEEHIDTASAAKIAERRLCRDMAQSCSRASPGSSAGVAAQEGGQGGAWPAGGACFMCEDAAADAMLIECGHGGLCSGDIIE